MIKNKYINLILVHAAVIFGILATLFILHDIKKVEKHFEDCRRECYPAKIIERFSYRECFCDMKYESENEE